MKRRSTTRQSQRLLLGCFSILMSIGIGLYTWVAIDEGSTTYTALNTIEKIRSPKGISYHASALLASANIPVHVGILGLRIEPNNPESRTLYPGNSVRLTSIGIHTSGEAAIDSSWFATPLSTGKTTKLDSCTGQTTCLIQAALDPGITSITAESNGKQDTVDITVKNPIARAKFSDAVPDWAESSISTLNELGIIQGYDDGRFGAVDSLSHAQWVTLLYRVLLEKNIVRAPSGCQQYSASIGYDHFAFDAVCLFHQAGWIYGDSFDGNAPVSRGQTAAYINRIFGPSLMQALGTNQGDIGNLGQIFSDVPSNNQYFYDTGVTNAGGIMTGNPNGSFGVNAILNRAESATVLFRLYRQIEILGISSL